jgi:hypothetical protein
MIVTSGLTKRYGKTAAVDGLSFTGHLATGPAHPPPVG